MKRLLVAALLVCTAQLHAQNGTAGTFKAISSTATVPFSTYLWYDSTQVITSANESILSRASIPAQKAFSLADKNKNNKVTYKELTDALNKDLFYLSLDIIGIKKYFIQLDENHDGYLANETGISFIDSAITMVESLDHKKYAYTCGEATYDQNRNIRPTGSCRKDGKLSVSELCNASEEKKIWIASRVYWKY